MCHYSEASEGMVSLTLMIALGLQTFAGAWKRRSPAMQTSDSQSYDTVSTVMLLGA